MDTKELPSDEPQDRGPEIALAVDAGVIPNDPVAAYQLGRQHGCAEATGDRHNGACWACGKSREMPSHQAQIHDLATQHYQHSGIFHWHPDEFAALANQNDVTPAGFVETAGARVYLRLDGAIRMAPR